MKPRIDTTVDKLVEDGYDLFVRIEAGNTYVVCKVTATQLSKAVFIGNREGRLTVEKSYGRNNKKMATVIEIYNPSFKGSS